MMGFHWEYLLIILAIVLIIFGPSKLPQLGGAVGKTMREFRKATDGVDEDVKKATETSADAKPTTVVVSSDKNSN